MKYIEFFLHSQKAFIEANKNNFLEGESPKLESINWIKKKYCSVF